MAANITAIIKAISYINNRYRDSSISTRMKLEALWEMGDLLAKLGVTKPHSIGWAVQRGTKGLIKRPTIFRSHKIDKDYLAIKGNATRRSWGPIGTFQLDRTSAAN